MNLWNLVGLTGPSPLKLIKGCVGGSITGFCFGALEAAPAFCWGFGGDAVGGFMVSPSQKVSSSLLNGSLPAGAFALREVGFVEGTLLVAAGASIVASRGSRRVTS